jgi:hypothetical protein
MWADVGARPLVTRREPAKSDEADETLHESPEILTKDATGCFS